MKIGSHSAPRVVTHSLLLSWALSSCNVRAPQSFSSSAGTSPEQASYDDQSAGVKQQIIQQAVEASKYQSLPQWSGNEPLAMFALALNPIRSMVRNFFNVTLERNSDVMPDGRQKGIHTYGSTAAIEFVVDGQSPFTGLYQGVKHGVIRMSLATKPSATNTVPGVGVKFFIDGKPSMNFVAMYSLEGQSGYNFFANEFSTFVSAPSTGPLKILGAAFGTATQDPTKVDVAYMARMNQDGSSVANPVAPERLVLVPNRDKLVFADAQHEVREDLATIPPGTTLYKIYGLLPNDTGRIYIGRFVTTSSVVASKFGDQKLFFRHQRFNDK